MSDQQYGRRAVEVGPTGVTVAENLARLRKMRGFSTRQLAAEMERRGRAVSPSGITRMEKGDRVVTADDLVAFAVIFGVSPVTLLLPVDARGTAQVTGAGEVDARTAWHWAWCESPLSLPRNEHEAERAYTEFMLYSRPIGLFTSQGDDRIPGFTREPRTGGEGGKGLD